MSKQRPMPPATAQAGIIATQTTWRGPLPDPVSLESYKRLVPDAPERILAMAEDEARTRREQMQKDHESINRTKEQDVLAYHAGVKRGQWMAFGILIVTIAGAVYCAAIGNTSVAITLAGVGLANIAAQFISKWKR